MSLHNDSHNLSALLHDTEQMEAGIVGSQSNVKLKETIGVILEKVNEICTVNNKILAKIRSLQENNDKMYDELYEQKVDLTDLNQYGRRENVEICGILESVSQDELQKHILDVTKTMGVKVPPNGIHIVHRIGKSRNSRPRNVIVRFVNRQTAFSLLKNKRKLNNGRYKNYFITENLCPYNKKIFNKLYGLKQNKDIHSLWTYNGNIFVKIRENDDRQQVYHLDDIESLFEPSEANSDTDSRFGHVASVSGDSDAGDSSPDAPNAAAADENHPSSLSNQSSQNSVQSSSSRKPPVPPKPSLSSTHLSVVEEEDSFVSTPIEPIRITV